MEVGHQYNRECRTFRHYHFDHMDGPWICSDWAGAGISVFLNLSLPFPCPARSMCYGLNDVDVVLSTFPYHHMLNMGMVNRVSSCLDYLVGWLDLCMVDGTFNQPSKWSISKSPHVGTRSPWHMLGACQMVQTRWGKADAWITPYDWVLYLLWSWHRVDKVVQLLGDKSIAMAEPSVTRHA